MTVFIQLKKVFAYADALGTDYTYLVLWHGLCLFCIKIVSSVKLTRH